MLLLSHGVNQFMGVIVDNKRILKTMKDSILVVISKEKRKAINDIVRNDFQIDLLKRLNVIRQHMDEVKPVYKLRKDMGLNTITLTRFLRGNYHFHFSTLIKIEKYVSKQEKKLGLSIL